MRSLFVALHRWAGLFIAVFLFVTGLTGAVISWDHELDEWLNPHLNDARAAGPARDPLELVPEVEARHPQVRVTSLPLAAEPGHTYSFWVEARVDPATDRLYEPGYNQIFVDPASGEELGQREWGAVWPITRENFVSFLYKLHFSLHIPEIAGNDRWGLWLLGVVALIWTVDCFTGVYLTLPARRRARAAARAEALAAEDQLAEDQASTTTAASVRRSWWQRWKPAWKVRWRGGPYQINFDLHRAGSLWTWGLLFIVAFTAFSLNLYREVFFPAMTLVSDATPSPFELREPRPMNRPIAETYSYREAVDKARAEARRRGWDAPPGSMFYSPEFGIYGVAFFHPEEGHGAGGVGHRTLYFDGVDGSLLGTREPWTGTAADLFVQAQFPLHSGRILGLPGRILISVMGLVVAMLSVTGVYIWWKKRKARLKKAGAAPRNTLANAAR